MNVHPKICNRAVIESYLEDRLDPEQESRLLQHLAKCEIRRQRIQLAAAEPSEWSEAEEFLRDQPSVVWLTAVEQSTTWELPSHNVTREFRGLIQIDQRLPEGTPLFKDGELAGITLLGTRFMKDDAPGSYVVPASRIFEVLRQVKTE